MSWIIISIFAYFLLSLAFLIDKILLKKGIPSPAAYAFFVALFSLATFVFVPLINFLSAAFSFSFPVSLEISFSDWRLASSSLIGGAIFLYALVFYYQAAKKNEISRVAPLVFSVISSICTFFISSVVLGNVFDSRDFWGIVFLAIGGFLISFDLPIKSFKIFGGFQFSLISGILLGISNVFFDKIYSLGGFAEGFVWTRLGIFLGGVSLLFFASFRKEILDSVRRIRFRKSVQKSENFATVILFFVNKIFGGSSTFLIHVSIAMAGSTRVNAISSVQFVFILVLVGLASVKYHHIFREKLFFWDWAQKIISILIIALGVFFIA